MSIATALQVSINAKVLTDALKVCKRVATKRNSIPVLTFARLHGTLLTATDLDNTTHVVVGDYHNSDFLIPVHPMLELLRDTSPDMEIGLTYNPDAQLVEVRMGELQVNLVSMPVIDFPSVPMPRIIGPAFELPSIGWARMFRETLPAVSEESSRFTLHSVLFVPESDGFAMVSTDGHRLHLSRTHTERRPLLAESVLVSSDALRALLPLLNPRPGHPVRYAHFPPAEGNTIGYSEFEAGNVTLIARTPSGQFPNYKAVLPDPKMFEYSAAITRDSFVDAVKRVKASCKAKGNVEPYVLALSIGAGTMQVTACDVSTTLQVATTGKAVVIGFNADYLLDIATNMPESFAMHGRDEEHLAMFSGPHFDAVLMPVHI